jgi:hypothetical protein
MKKFIIVCMLLVSSSIWAESVKLEGYALLIDDERTSLNIEGDLAQKFYESIPNQRHGADSFDERTREVTKGFVVTTRSKVNIKCDKTVIDESLEGQFQVGTSYKCEMMFFQNWASFWDYQNGTMD